MNSVSRSKTFHRHDNEGFTLIELLVVVDIIGILSTIAVSSLSMARKKALDARKLSDLNRIQKAFEAFYLDHGYYPINGYVNTSFPDTNTGYKNLKVILKDYIDLPVTEKTSSDWYYIRSYGGYSGSAVVNGKTAYKYQAITIETQLYTKSAQSDKIQPYDCQGNPIPNSFNGQTYNKSYSYYAILCGS